MAGTETAWKRLLLSLIAAMLFLCVAPELSDSRSGSVWGAEAADAALSTSGKTGFVRKKKDWYYLVNGKKQTGWIKVGERTYYARKSGKQKRILVKGWLKKGKNWYYFREKGKRGKVCSMVSDCTYKVNGISCIFNKDGSFSKCKYEGSRKGFIQTIGEMARENQAKYNILASLVTAQACLETGYGQYIKHNNLFGMMSRSGLRHYSSWDKSLKAYTTFMQSYLPQVFGVRNSSRACSIVGKSGYAAAGNYGSYLLSIIQSQNLTRFNR